MIDWILLKMGRSGVLALRSGRAGSEPPASAPNDITSEDCTAGATMEAKEGVPAPVERTPPSRLATSEAK